MKALLAALALTGLSLAAAPAHSQTVTFIHFNDLHAHLTPHMDAVADGRGGVRYETRGGIARLATLVKQIRKDNPDSVLMNIGDTTHGGVEALFTNGNAVVDSVNALGVDVGVPGNWDFAYGPDVTRLRYVENLRPMEKRMLGMRGSSDIKRFNFPNLAANVTFRMPFYKSGQTLLPATLTKTVGGIKVGFIGLTSDIVPEMHKMLAFGLDFAQGEAAHRDIVQTHARQLRKDGAQLVVVMSELGLQKDKQLADGLESGLVDVVFSAHTHETVFEPIISKSGARVVEAGNDGWLGRMDVDVKANEKPVFRWKLLPINERVAEDAAVARLVAAARAPFLKADPDLKLPQSEVELELHQSIDTVIGQVKQPLDRRNSLESSFNNAWTDTLRQGMGTELALSPGFRFDAIIPGYEDGHAARGAITVEDAFRFFPVPYTLAQGKVSGERIRAILEDALTAVYSEDAFHQHGGWVDGVSGLNVALDLGKADGARISSVSLTDGRKLTAGDTYTIAGCQRPMDSADILCSKNGFIDVKPFVNPKTDSPWQAVDYFMYATKNGWLGDGKRRNLTDSSNQSQWPKAPYVQPLAGGNGKQVEIRSK